MMRTWDKIEEPDESVQAVRDNGGDLWRRKPDGTWVCMPSGDQYAWGTDIGGCGGSTWMQIMLFAPLRETSQEAEQLAAIGPIEITQAAIDAAVEVIERPFCGMRQAIAAALEALGFTVKS